MHKESNKYLIWIIASFLIAGIIEGYYGIDSDNAKSISIAHTLIFIFLIWAWCKMHAEENNLNKVNGYCVFVAFFPPVGVPTYFLKFFGLKKGAMRTLKAIGFTCILALFYLIPLIIFENLL
jgi:hypothetical protein